MSSPVHSSGSHQRSGPSASTITPARQLVQTDIGVLAMARWFPAGDSAVAAPAGAHATAAPLIVLLHGMFGNTDVWAATALNLARAGLEVLAFDLPGHGESRTRMASPEDTVQALAQALHTVANRPLVLVGQSFGTLIATRLMSLLSASRNAGTTQDEHAACSASDVRPQFPRPCLPVPLIRIRALWACPRQRMLLPALRLLSGWCCCHRWGWGRT